jgi:hypothetical protein
MSHIVTIDRFFTPEPYDGEFTFFSFFKYLTSEQKKDLFSIIRDYKGSFEQAINHFITILETTAENNIKNFYDNWGKRFDSKTGEPIVAILAKVPLKDLNETKKFVQNMVLIEKESLNFSLEEIESFFMANNMNLNPELMKNFMKIGSYGEERLVDTDNDGNYDVFFKPFKSREMLNFLPAITGDKAEKLTRITMTEEQYKSLLKQDKKNSVIKRREFDSKYGMTYIPRDRMLDRLRDNLSKVTNNYFYGENGYQLKPENAKKLIEVCDNPELLQKFQKETMVMQLIGLDQKHRIDIFNKLAQNGDVNNIVAYIEKGFVFKPNSQYFNDFIKLIEENFIKNDRKKILNALNNQYVKLQEFLSVDKLTNILAKKPYLKQLIDENNFKMTPSILIDLIETNSIGRFTIKCSDYDEDWNKELTTLVEKKITEIYKENRQYINGSDYCPKVLHMEAFLKSLTTIGFNINSISMNVVSKLNMKAIGEETYGALKDKYNEESNFYKVDGIFKKLGYEFAPSKPKLVSVEQIEPILKNDVVEEPSKIVKINKIDNASSINMMEKMNDILKQIESVKSNLSEEQLITFKEKLKFYVSHKL